MRDHPPASFTVVFVAGAVDWLDALAMLAGPPREVCLLDRPPHEPIAPAVACRVKLVHEPLGHEPVGRNLGLAAAAGDVVVFHDDTSPAADLLETLAAAFADHGVAAVVGERAFVAFRRVDLVAIGGFDESRSEGDDLRDACRRLEDSGRTVTTLAPCPTWPERPDAPAARRRLMPAGFAARRRRPFVPLVAGAAAAGPIPATRPSDRQAAAGLPTTAAAGATAPQDDGDPLAAARRTLRRIWADLLPSGSRCALVGYPDHWNVGDAAIWWGTRRLLDAIGVAVDYACDPWSYEPAALQAAVPDGPILILGGGNLGDAYRHEQSLRERILRDFPRRRIVQLPQSVWFASHPRAEALADLLLHAGDVTLLLRDADSLAFARESFRCDSALCPDSAIALELAGTGGTPEVPLLALWRTDTEARETPAALHDGLVVTDWTAPGPEIGRMTTAARGFLDWVGAPPAEIGSCPQRRRLAWKHAPWLWDQLAEDRTLRGCRILSRGRVVLTDRLHAHLLCSLMRRPHVVCDSANGKIFAYRDTWRIDDPLVRFASTRAEAVEMGRDLLATGSAQDAGGSGA